MTTLIDSPEVKAERQAALRDVLAAQRIALETFVERYGWYCVGKHYVGHPDDPVPAELAVENTLRALWKGACADPAKTASGS